MYPSESPWAWGWIINMNELMKEHSKEVMTEELKELQKQQHAEVLKVELEVEEVISSSEIKEMFRI